MPMTVSFQNPGLIDLRAIQIMGVSVKDTDNPIGYFGTGLKYAIATLLRNSQSITIWRGLEPYRFSASAENIRGKSFSVVRMNGEPLGITTDLGRNWQMCHAFREVYAHNLDERGTQALGAVAVGFRRVGRLLKRSDDRRSSPIRWIGIIASFLPGLTNRFRCSGRALFHR